MSVEKRRITDGVSLNIIETDKFKTNYISVNLISPLSSDTAAYMALLPAVLKRGTVSYPDMAALQKRFDMLYSTNVWGGNYKRGETQIIRFGANMLANEYIPDDTDVLGGTLDLLREIMFAPLTENGAFKKEYVDGEKRNQIDSIKAMINNKNSYAVWRCQEEMCRGELYSVPNSGTVEQVEAITPASLYDFYKKIIVTAPVEIYFVGKCDFDALESGLRDIFTPYAHNAGELPPTQVIRSAGELREFTEDQPVTQGKLSIGFRTAKVLADGDYHKFVMFCEIFGGSPSSKLFMNVREKLSLCYYCQAIPHAQKGIMIVASGIEVEKKQEAQDEILAQLDNIKKGDFTEEEFKAARNGIINDYRGVGDNAGSMEAWYMDRAYAGLSSSPEEAAALIDGVTREDVIAAANAVTLDTIYFMRGTLKADAQDGQTEGEE